VRGWNASALIACEKGRLSPQKLAGRQLDDDDNDDNDIPASHTAIERSRLPASVYTRCPVTLRAVSSCLGVARAQASVSARALRHLQEKGRKVLEEDARVARSRVRDFFA
jgi:hypothetical protein